VIISLLRSAFGHHSSCKKIHSATNRCVLWTDPQRQ